MKNSTKIYTQTTVCYMGVHPLCSAVSRRGLNPIKLAYWADSRLY